MNAEKILVSAITFFVTPPTLKSLFVTFLIDSSQPFPMWHSF